MVAAKGSDDLRWVTAASLVALAAHGMVKGSTFTAQDLREWIPQLKTGSKCKQATAMLIKLGFVVAQRSVDKEAGTNISRYTVTLEGAAAIKSAGQGNVHTSGPRGGHTKDRAVPPTTFAARLWALMRARCTLDSDTAAATLVDAGDDVKKAAKNAQRYLARWASTGAITPGRVREANGCKRYVLTKDTGPTPPAWTPKAKARQAAQTNE